MVSPRNTSMGLLGAGTVTLALGGVDLAADLTAPVIVGAGGLLVLLGAAIWWAGRREFE